MDATGENGDEVNIAPLLLKSGGIAPLVLH
jgi:hypothetical protein